MGKDIPNLESQAVDHPLWHALRDRLRAADFHVLGRKIGLSESSISKCRHDLAGPLARLKPPYRLSLLRQLTGTFARQAGAEAWLAEAGWPLLADERQFLTTFFRRQTRLPWLKHLTAFYEPRADLEAQLRAALDPAAAGQGAVVWGVGGIGKTTLVLAVLKSRLDLLAEYPDGVYRLDCTGLSLREIVLNLCDALGLPVASPAAAAYSRALADYLRDHVVLLVLESVGHLSDLRELLIGLEPPSRLIATTRQGVVESEAKRLGLRSIPVPPLNLPQALALIEQVQAGPVAPDDEAVLADLVARVEGHPLALELLVDLKLTTQAAWTDLLAAVQRAPLATLEQVEPGGPQDSVRLCFDLSYRQLAERQPEATAWFRALGVFPWAAGPVSLWRSVMAEPNRALPNLNILARYGLIRLSEPREQTWRTHRLLLDYAAEKLRADTAEFQMRARQYGQTVERVAAAWNWTFRAEPQAAAEFGPWQAEARHAVELAAQVGDWSTALSIAWCSADWLLAAGDLAGLAGLLARLDQAPADSGLWGDSQRAVQQVLLGKYELAQQNLAQAAMHFRQALDRQPTGRWALRLELDLALCQHALGQRAEAWQLLDRAYGRLAELDLMERGLLRADWFTRVGLLALAEDNAALAQPNLEQAADLYEAAGLKTLAAWNCVRLAECQVEAEPAEALRLLALAEEALGRATWPLLWLTAVVDAYALAYLALARYGELAKLLARFERDLQALADSPSVDANWAKVWQWRGASHFQQDQFEAAVGCFQQSLDYWQRVPDSAVIQGHVRQWLSAAEAQVRR